MNTLLNIENLAYCSLSFDNESLPPSPNCIDEILSVEGFGSALPTLRLKLRDPQDTLARQLNIMDGSPISLRLGLDSRAPEWRFRVTSWSRPRNVEPTLQIVAILDAPKFVYGVYAEAVDGTSDEVMQYIASESGLTYSGTPTQDKQVWLNMNTNRLSWSEDVAMHGYNDDQSAMYRLVTRDKTLHYVNLFDIIRKEPKATLCHNFTGEGLATKYTVRCVNDMSTSGISNRDGNYGQRTVVPGAQEDRLYNSLNVPVWGVDAPVNRDVWEAVKESGSKVTYAGFDHGNVHDNYERAKYQNQRFIKLHSERIKVLLDTFTDLQTFDCVEFIQKTGNQSESSIETLNGKYVVGGKSVLIKGGSRYAECLYLYRAYRTESYMPAQTNQQDTFNFDFSFF